MLANLAATLLFGLLFASLSTWAQQPAKLSNGTSQVKSTLAVKEKNRWGGVVAFHMESALDQRNIESKDQYTSLRGFLIGARKDHHYFQLERTEYKIESALAVMSVEKKTENYWLSYWYEFAGNFILVPGLGGGAGMSRDFLTTTLYSQVERDQSAWNYGAFVGSRIRLNLSYIWTSFELRVTSISNWKPSPTVAGILQVGMHF